MMMVVVELVGKVMPAELQIPLRLFAARLLDDARRLRALGLLGRDHVGRALFAVLLAALALHRRQKLWAHLLLATATAAAHILAALRRFCNEHKLVGKSLRGQTC